MSEASDRHRRVGASFTQQYYTKLVREPSELPNFYVQDASFEHLGHKATGVKAIREAVDRLYPVLVDAVVNIVSLSSEVGSDGNISLTIQGVLTVSPTLSHNFTHEVVLMEHKAHPGSFGVVRDRRINNPSEEAQKRWALETPPMFAQESPKEELPPMEDLAPSRAGVAAQRVSSTTQPAAEAAVEKPADSGAPAVPDAEAETRRPKSFAEAIKLGKQVGSNASQVAPRLVVAKGVKDHAEEPPVRVKASEPQREGAKALTRDSTGAKKGATAKKRDGSEKNGKEASDRSSGKPNGREGPNRSKGKDAEGRTLSRFVVFYDVIVKGLPPTATEQTVRDLVEPMAPVKLVKLLSQNDKKDTNIIRTFSFVQLDHDAIKEAGGNVKATVAKLLESSKGKKGSGGSRIQIDEVREKYTAAPAQTSGEAANADCSQ
ncbi:hypothetical protein, conserved [Trypanosoma brucei gambiense DAL972]|uniref:NTF2 domain-containing protein n=1 Tax=Trypanosoma brucei gambiense (strain MHOM/CI/86/DAL972) TaxID=679716 RepID=D0A036_TRYB9|nr:hypothetical protein, conserved [Trypanosoma brucei gambiense DAL972]CBH16594.1 hypothetical protein, conserved [Trypanosoma brucei gambiense DAL972]|eukprot:XP_011778858.1 hypothetical protein, conserved [Trypanosoma brucei gambiense DAL972]